MLTTTKQSFKNEKNPNSPGVLCLTHASGTLLSKKYLKGARKLRCRKYFSTHTRHTVWLKENNGWMSLNCEN